MRGITDALLWYSWLLIQRHIYAHAAHGTVTTCGGWQATIWERFGRRQVLVSPLHADADLAQLRRFLDGLGASGNALIETCEVLHPGVIRGLRDDGWRVGYELPVHFIPAFDDEWRARLAPCPEGFKVRIVDAEAALSDFAYVQDRAYREAYDLPRGCMSLFYASLPSVCGPDTVAAILYDADDQPIRAAQLIRAGGLVHGVAGAVVPSSRGRHLGEPLMFVLTEVARSQFGAHDVVHATMPVALPIAKRLSLTEVSRWVRWTKG